MKCEGARDLLSALVDDALDPAGASAVREHLDACEACRRRHAELEAVVHLVREIPAPRMPDGLAADVVSRLSRRSIPAPIRWLAPLAAAACLLLVVKFGFLSDKMPAVREVAETKDAEGLAGEPAPAKEVTAYHRQAESLGKDRSPGRPTFSGKADGPPVGEAEEPPAPATAPDAASPRRTTAAGRKYAVRGVEPDTAAGVILAELGCRRTREDLGGEPAGERVVQGRSGEVSGMLLYLTPGEIEFVTCLLEERPGVRVARLNGRGKGKKARAAHEETEAHDDAGDEADQAPERMRVEFRFR